MKSPVLWAVLLLLCGKVSLYAKPPQLAFEKIKKLLIVEAKVEDQKGYFILDTGASHLTLNKKHFADKKILKNVGTTSTILGEQVLQAIKIEAFSWGEVHREKLLCPISDLSNLEKWLGFPILGLIGFDILSDYQVLIDYDNQSITLFDKSEATENWTTTPTYALDFNLCGHLPVIEVNVGNDQKVYLGFDSGATVNVLDKSWRKRVAQPLGSGKVQNKIRFTGASAGIKEADCLAFDLITLDNQLTISTASLVLTDFEVPTGRCFRIDGLLSADAMNCNKMVIDYRKSVLYIWQNEAPACKMMLTEWN